MKPEVIFHFKPHALKPLPGQLIEINKRRRTGTETVKDIMLSLGANIDLDIYLHPYKEEILQSAPKVRQLCCVSYSV